MDAKILQRLRELGVMVRRLDLDAIMLRWEAGVLLDQAYPDRLVPQWERVALREKGSMSVDLAHTCQRFHRKFPERNEAERFVSVCSGWGDVSWAVKAEDPWSRLSAFHQDRDLYRSDFNAWREKHSNDYQNWAEERIRRSEFTDSNSSMIHVTVPADFARELIDKGFTRRQIQRVYLAYHNFPEIKDDIRNMLKSGEGL